MWQVCFLHNTHVAGCGTTMSLRYMYMPVCCHGLHLLWENICVQTANVFPHVNYKAILELGYLCTNVQRAERDSSRILAQLHKMLGNVRRYQCSSQGRTMQPDILSVLKMGGVMSKTHWGSKQHKTPKRWQEGTEGNRYSPPPSVQNQSFQVRKNSRHTSQIP